MLSGGFAASGRDLLGGFDGGEGGGDTGVAEAAGGGRGVTGIDNLADSRFLPYHILVKLRRQKGTVTYPAVLP